MAPHRPGPALRTPPAPDVALTRPGASPHFVQITQFFDTLLHASTGNLRLSHDVSDDPEKRATGGSATHADNAASRASHPSAPSSEIDLELLSANLTSWKQGVPHSPRKFSLPSQQKMEPAAW